MSDELVATLGIEAVKIARSSGATVVDVNHVNRAYANSKPSKWENLSLAFLGLFGGISGGMFITIFSTDAAHKMGWYIAAAVFGILTVGILIGVVRAVWKA
jgi:hypothetical protein